MFARLFISIFAILIGLVGFGRDWAETQRSPKTIWLRQVSQQPIAFAEAQSRHIEDFIVRKQEESNSTYVAYLSAEQERLASLWGPHQSLKNIVSRYNPKLSTSQVHSIAEAIVASSQRHRLDPFLLAALIAKESRFRPHCTSPGGAVGLGQLLPSTARRLGVDPFEPTQNIEGCAKYLAAHMRRWKQSPETTKLALASYNAGPGAVQRFGGVPPYRITQAYVSEITARQRDFLRAAQKERDHWLLANSPDMRDLFGKKLTAKS